MVTPAMADRCHHLVAAGVDPQIAAITVADEEVYAGRLLIDDFASTVQRLTEAVSI